MATGVAVLMPLVLARRLNLQDYGTYKQLFLIAMTLQAVLPFGMAQSLYFFLPREDEKKPYLVQTHLFLLLGGGLAAFLFLAFSGSVAQAFSNPGILEYRGLLGTYLVCAIGAYPLEMALTSQGKTRQSAVSYVVWDTLRAAAMILPVLLGFGLRGSLFAVVGVSALRLIAAWSLITFAVEGKWWDGRAFLKQLAYAAPYGAAMFLNQPQQAAHQYAVSAIVTPSLFAIYAVGCFQMPFIDLFYQPTSEVLMVRIGELERKGRVGESIHAFREAASRLAYLFLPLGAFFFVAAPEIISTLFGPKFLAAVPIFRVSVAGVAMTILPMDGVLRARNETQYLFVSYLIKALVTVPLLYFGVRHYGMMGGIGAWAVAELIGKLMLLMRLPHALSSPQLKVRIVDLLPRRPLLTAAAAAGISALSVALLHGAFPGTWFGASAGLTGRLAPLAASALLFALTYLAALLAMGIKPLRALARFRGLPAPASLNSEGVAN
jgi:O-antigen/teichoic acid export membrane protein